jgi:hypothetical protein
VNWEESLGRAGNDGSGLFGHASCGGETARAMIHPGFIDPPATAAETGFDIDIGGISEVTGGRRANSANNVE